MQQQQVEGGARRRRREAGNRSAQASMSCHAGASTRVVVCA
jgi:hypothetical protein